MTVCYSGQITSARDPIGSTPVFAPCTRQADRLDSMIYSLMGACIAAVKGPGIFLDQSSHGSMAHSLRLVAVYLCFSKLLL